MSTLWPPKLAGLRRELGRVPGDSADDDLLTDSLNAAIAFVLRVHAGRYNFDDSSPLLPDVPADMVLGTTYLAKRLHSRRRSPDALIDLGELGSARIPSFDPDIDFMLRIGRYRTAVYG